MRAESPAGRTSGVVCILITLLGWSSVPLFLKYFTSMIDGWTTNGWRYGISALIWSPVLIAGFSRGVLPKGLWRAAVVPSAFNVSAQCCFAWAPYYINPGLLTFMLRLQIVFVAVGTYLLFPAERAVLRSRNYWSGTLIVLCGLLALCFLGPELPRGATAFGIILALSAGMLYGGYALAVRHFMRDVHSVLAFAAISSLTSFCVVPIMLVFGADHGATVWSFTAAQFGMLVASALVGIAITHVLYYAALARLGVAVSAGVILLQPFLTSIASYYIFDEKLTIPQWCGGLFALVGATLILTAQSTPVEARLPSRSTDGKGSTQKENE